MAGRIQLHGANVTVYDPEAMENARKVRPTLRYAASATEACEGAHAVLHLTEWPEFRELDPAALRGVRRAPGGDRRPAVCSTRRVARRRLDLPGPRQAVVPRELGHDP